jgi:hypothetical protein
MGLNRVEKKYFTFFSDDDIWIPNSLVHHREKLLKSNLDFVLGSVAIEAQNHEKKIKPKKPIQKSFFELLENPTLLRGRKYVSLTSFLGESKLTVNKFPEDVTFWEDILWLLTLEELGIKFEQDKIVRSIIRIDYSRGSKRESLEGYFSIAQKLEFLSRGRGKTFIQKIAIRNNLASGNSNKIFTLLKALKTQNGPLKFNALEIFVMTWWLLVARMVKEATKWKS